MVTGPQYSIFLISNWYWIFVWYFQFWHFCRGDYGNGSQKLIFSKLCENIPKLPQSFCPGLYVGIFNRTQQFSKVKFNSFFLNHTNNRKSRLEASTTSGKLIRKSRHSKSLLKIKEKYLEALVLYKYARASITTEKWVRTSRQFRSLLNTFSKFWSICTFL